MADPGKKDKVTPGDGGNPDSACRSTMATRTLGQSKINKDVQGREEREGKETGRERKEENGGGKTRAVTQQPCTQKEQES